MATASQPSCHKLDSTNQRRGCGHRCTFGPFPSHVLPLTTGLDSLRSSRGLVLPCCYSLSSDLFFLGRSAAATPAPAAPASQPFNSNQFTLARDPNPSYERILVSTTEPQDFTPLPLLTSGGTTPIRHFTRTNPTTSDNAVTRPFETPPAK